MNQSELILKTAQISGLTRRDVEHVLKTAGDVIQAALTEEGEAILPGIGRLTVRARAARNGRNPATGATITIPARLVPHFSAAKVLKDAVSA